MWHFAHELLSYKQVLWVKCRFYPLKVAVFSDNLDKTSENLRGNSPCSFENVRRFFKNDGLFRNYLLQTAQFKL